MMNLVYEAQALIMDRPEEAKLIHWALSLDQESKAAFMMAWNLIHNNEED